MVWNIIALHLTEEFLQDTPSIYLLKLCYGQLKWLPNMNNISEGLFALAGRQTCISKLPPKAQQRQEPSRGRN